MRRHHTVLEVAALTLVGLVAVVTLVISLSNWDPPMLAYSLSLVSATALIWSGGWRGDLGAVAGLLGVAVGVRGVVGILALVVLFTWAGERATRAIRAGGSAETRSAVNGTRSR